MGYIISLLTKLDAAIQKRFDSICFFLMRRFGVRKSMIRYMLSAVSIICIASSAFLGAYTTTSLVVCLILAIYVGIRATFALLFMQHNAMKEDLLAEGSPGTCSKADARADGTFKLFWLGMTCITLGLLLDSIPISSFASILEVRVREARMMMSGLVAFLITRLALEYLKKTPMNPPAEKAREHVGTAQPAPAKS